MTATLAIAAGALEAEELLVRELEALRDETRADPALLARPVRVVVPSRSLRLHLGERLGTRLGAVAGVELQTLHALAIGVLERAGVAVPAGDALVEVLARRLAREERALREAFEPFQDGYRTVAGTVRDLFDAGFEPEQSDALLERVAELRLAPAEKRRAEAVVRTAARVAAELDERGAGGRSELLRRAREAFEADPEGTLPTRLVVLHGFADTTGRAGDLIEALLRRLPSRVLFDHPSDPDDPTRADLGVAFTHRLLERLQGSTGPPTLPARDAAGPAITRFRAPGQAAEVRAIAQRIRGLLDDGVAPERIGVVARDLGGYRAPVRTHFARLGVPCAALRTRAPLDGVGRRITALTLLFEQRELTPVDRWLDALATLSWERAAPDKSDGVERVVRRVSPELRLGLRVVGAARLGEVAELDVDARVGEGALKLPVRTGVASGAADPESGREAIGFHAPHARLPRAELAAAVAEAGKLVRRFARWPKTAPLEKHVAELDKLRRSLGWKRDDRAETRLRPALERLAQAFPDEPLTTDEFALLARRALLPAAAPVFAGPPSGTTGGGVAILDAMEARGRTFEHLFVLGMNRDVFPRVAREDPLLSDDVRRALTDVLPDVPIAARGRDEDRYLFAQLVSSSPNVTLSWQLSDDDGKPRVVSPLVERLLGEQSEDSVPAVSKVYPLRAREVTGVHTASEHAVLGGLHVRREGFARRLELALFEVSGDRTGDRTGDVGARALARTRAAVLDAYEDGPFEPERLAPWLGFVGEQSEVGVRPDPRAEPLFVTRLEALARCPWQSMLRRLLRLEAAPDPLDALPGIEPRVVGNIVHGVLERIVRERTGDEEVDLTRALERTPVAIAWPDAQHLEELLLASAREEVQKERRPVAGLVRMLAECSRPHLERAREFFAEEQRRWPSIGALGAEVRGRARVALPASVGGEVELEFVADRVDRRDDTVVLSDYKTGKVSPEKKFKSEGIARGLQLQPMTYVLGAREADPSLRVRGRFLFTKADGVKEDVEVGLGEHFADQLPDFEAAVGTILRGYLAGTFFPRLHDEAKDSANEICRFCEVASACVNGDSGARRAVVALGRGEASAGPAGEALRELWQLATAGGGK